MYGYDDALSFVMYLFLNMNQSMKNSMITQQIQNCCVSLHHSSLFKFALCFYGTSYLPLILVSRAVF